MNVLFWRARYYTLVAVVGAVTGYTAATWLQQQYHMTKARVILALDLHDILNNE